MKFAKCFPYRGNISPRLRGLGRFLSQNRATFYACQTSPADRPFRREYNLRKIGGTPETQNRTELSFLTLVTRSRPLQKAEHDCDCEGRTQTHAGRTGRTSDHRPQGHYPAAAAAAGRVARSHRPRPPLCLPHAPSLPRCLAAAQVMLFKIPCHKGKHSGASGRSGSQVIHCVPYSVGPFNRLGLP